MNKCLYCYNKITEDLDFHQSCSESFFGSKIAPKLEFTISQINELAKNVVERSVSIISYIIYQTY